MEKMAFRFADVSRMVNRETSHYWFSESRLTLMDRVQLHIRLKKGFLLLTGEPGVGKTCFLETLIQRLPASVQVCYLSKPQTSFIQLLIDICRDFGIKNTLEKLSEENLLNLMYRHIVQKSFEGMNFVLIIDDSHKIEDDLLGGLSGLSELATSTKKLLQVLLVAQPEMSSRLQLPKFRELQKMVSGRFVLPPLTAQETQEFVLHTVEISGTADQIVYTPKALDKIFLYTNGFPKTIQLLCATVARLKDSGKKTRVSPAMVDRAWEFYLKKRGDINREQSGFIGSKEFQSILKHYKGWHAEKEFLEILTRERHRSDRTGVALSYVLINLPRSEHNVLRVPDKKYYRFLKELIILISENSRDSDIKYIFNNFKIGVLLIDTSLDGAKLFIEKIAGKLINRLYAENQPGDIQFIKTITIASYPVSQVRDFNIIEGTPVVLKNLKFNGKLSSGKNYSNQGLTLREQAKIHFNWDVVTGTESTLAISNHIFDDYLSRIRSEKLYYFAKRFIDIFGSLLGIIVFSPLMLFIALAVKLSSNGPVLFKQRRLGYLGVPFTFLKFRSMRIDANDRIHQEYVTKLIEGKTGEIDNGKKDQPLFKLDNDPRITKIGHILRKTSLDELPQLFNVLKGDMSLVGPRPPIPYEVEMYQTWHHRRILEVKPGVTGLWQVYGRSKTTFDEMVRLDLSYVNNHSILFDLKIILKTIGAVFNTEGAL